MKVDRDATATNRTIAIALVTAVLIVACGNTTSDQPAQPAPAADASPVAAAATSAPTEVASSAARQDATPSPAVATQSQRPEPRVQEYPVPRGSAPHDVAPAADGGVWYTAQRSGELGWLDPQSGETRHITLGPGSAPHGVIVGPDGAPWITDGGQNAIVRVDPSTNEVRLFRLPGANANLNTASFDNRGIL